MTATNSVAPRTGNVSAGTSTFAMIVLEKQLSKIYREIDMVTTPTGFPCAMSHANNGTSDLNAWVGLFEEFAQLMGYQTDTGELFSKLYTNSLNGDPDCGGLLAYGYYSGENVTYCLLCTAYTVVNIPLNTIVPRLTSDVHERDILVSTRMICAMIGTAIVMTITAPMVKFFGKGNEARGYLVTMTIYGIAAMLIFFVTFASTEEVVPPTVSNEKTTLLESLKGITGQAWILFLLNLFYFSLYVVRNTTVLYYFKYNLGRTEWLSLVGILGILSGLPMLLALPALEKRFSKRNLMFVSVALYIAGDLMIFLGKNFAVFLLAGLVITGLGIYGIFGITFAMQPDVIDYSEYKKNSSVAGLIAAFQGFFVKGGMGLTSFVIGAFLKNGGYVANAVQTDKALFFIEVCFIWIPVVLCVIIAVLTWFYKLDSLRSEMTEELESRRRKIANGNERCDF